MRALAILLIAAAAPAQVPAPSGWQVLFQDDFESGSLGAWNNTPIGDGPPWTLRQTAGGRVLYGSGNAFTSPGEGFWSDFRLRVRVRLLRGAIHLNYRFASERYIVRLEPGYVHLTRTMREVHTRVASVAGDFQLGRWHRFDILGLGPNVKVYVDDVRRIDYQDPDPILGGGFSFECLPGSEVEIDDVEVTGPPPGTMPAWIRAGGPPGGVGYDIRVRPDRPDLWYVTDNSSGVSISTDGGRTWSPSNQGITSRAGPTGDAIPVFCLTIDPNNPEIIWAGTQNMRGIYKSVDGGKTWVQKDRGVVERVGITFRGFTVEPGDSRTVYAAGELSTIAWAGESALAQGTKGVVYKTTDGGDNWRPVWRGDNLARYVWIDPRDSNVLYVSTGFWDREAANADLSRGFPGGVGVLKSRDGGQTWRVLNEANGLMNLFVGSLFMHPRNPDILLAGAGHADHTRGQGVYLTTDGGESWRNVLRPEYQLYSAPDRITAVEISRADPNIAYAASSAAFFRSDDGGRQWTGLNYPAVNVRAWFPRDVVIVEPTAVAAAPRTPGKVLTADDMGGNLLVSDDAGGEWNMGFHHPGVGDAFEQRHGFMALAFAFSNPNVAYAGLSHSRGYVDQRLPGGSFGIFRSTDGGLAWREANDARSAEQNVNVLVVDPRSEDVVYAGTLSSGVLRTLDGGRSWSPVNQGLRGLDVRALAIDPRNWTVLYAGLEGGGVYKSTDAGARWQPVNAGLDPGALIRDIVIDPANSNIVYAADLRTGVYRSGDAGKLWVQVNKGLSTRAVKALALSSDGGTLYAATEGEGVFRLDLKPFDR